MPSITDFGRIPQSKTYASWLFMMDTSFPMDQYTLIVSFTNISAILAPEAVFDSSTAALPVRSDNLRPLFARKSQGFTTRSLLATLAPNGISQKITVPNAYTELPAATFSRLHSNIPVCRILEKTLPGKLHRTSVINIHLQCHTSQMKAADLCHAENATQHNTNR
ncbi:hypothetical protein BN1708_007231 [Verticillium longisporum]|uniref:Uncharacterized protein n=1 Tax=Verticillium longisporum TaxID=100787 RepID=A0A0G4MRL1_VERLO|nr:hypothetical protein BN1708_007231 [Verticillium longisporum]